MDIQRSVRCGCVSTTTFTTATIASWEIFGPCDFSQGVFVFRPVSQALSNRMIINLTPPNCSRSTFLTVDPQREREREIDSQKIVQALGGKDQWTKIPKINLHAEIHIVTPPEKKCNERKMPLKNADTEIANLVFSDLFFSCHALIRLEFTLSMDFQKAHQNNTLKKPTLIQSNQRKQLFLCCFFVRGGDPKHWFGFLVSRRVVFFGFGDVSGLVPSKRKVWFTLRLVMSQPGNLGFDGQAVLVVSWVFSEMKTKYRNRNASLTFSPKWMDIFGSQQQKLWEEPEKTARVSFSC